MTSASAAFSNSDRESIRQIAGADMENLVAEYTQKRGRQYFCPFHENRRTPSASVHKGKFHCFGCGVNLGPFDFIQRAHGVGFKEALDFLSARYCIPLNNQTLAPEERSRYLRLRAVADVEAEALVNWRNEILELLYQARDASFHAFHRASNFIVKHSLDHPRAEVAVGVADVNEARYLDMERRIRLVKEAPWAVLRDFFRNKTLGGVDPGRLA